MSKHDRWSKANSRSRWDAEHTDDPDVGKRFRLEVQKHARESLWRFVEVSVNDAGERVENVLRWTPFPDMLPELALAHRRFQNFVVQLGPTPPLRVRLSDE